MKTLTYTQLLNQTLDLYMIGHYTEAYEFITERSAEVSGNQAQIYNFRYSIACKADLFDLAMAIFEEAVETHGFWYSYHYLTTDEDLVSLRQNLRFKELAEICKKREQVAKLNSTPVLKVLKLENPEAHQAENPKTLQAKNLETEGEREDSAPAKLGLFVALHGNQENIAIAEPYWSVVTNHAYVLALPQSSQIEFSDAYDWDDIEKGANELKAHMDRLLENPLIDQSNILLGAFSAGAGPSLYAILKEMITVKALILVAPWLPEIDRWAPMLDILKTKNVQCHILCGELDEDCLESSQAFVKQLKKKQIPYTLNLVENLDHDFPESFNEDLLKYLTIERSGI